MGMGNWKRFAVLCGLVLVGFGLITFVGGWQALKWMAALREEARTRELPTQEIRPTFVRLARHDLPGKADGLRAIYQGGRDAGIFARFTTDDEGIDYVASTFCGKRGTDNALSADEWTAKNSPASTLFTGPTFWQQRLGVSLFDPDSIESARVLKSGPIKRTRYEILIDDSHKTVYIYAYLR
jgi:hypothetical protein